MYSSLIKILINSFLNSAKIFRAPSWCRRETNTYRSLHGQCNDFDNPAAGSLYYRFGNQLLVFYCVFKTMIQTIRDGKS